MGGKKGGLLASIPNQSLYFLNRLRLSLELKLNIIKRKFKIKIKGIGFGSWSQPKTIAF